MKVRKYDYIYYKTAMLVVIIINAFFLVSCGKDSVSEDIENDIEVQEENEYETNESIETSMEAESDNEQENNDIQEVTYPINSLKTSIYSTSAGDYESDRSGNFNESRAVIRIDYNGQERDAIIDRDFNLICILDEEGYLHNYKDGYSYVETENSFKILDIDGNITYEQNGDDENSYYVNSYGDGLFLISHDVSSLTQSGTYLCIIDHEGNSLVDEYKWEDNYLYSRYVGDSIFQIVNFSDYVQDESGYYFDAANNTVTSGGEYSGPFFDDGTEEDVVIPDFPEGVEVVDYYKASDNCIPIILKSVDGWCYVTIADESNNLIYEPIKLQYSSNSYDYSLRRENVTDEKDRRVSYSQGYFSYDENINTYRIITPDGEDSQYECPVYTPGQAFGNRLLGFSDGWIVYGRCYVSLDRSKIIDKVVCNKDTKIISN